MPISIDIAKSFAPPPGFTLRVRLETRTDRLALFGPSGSGKSLTLKALAGLVRPGRGRISLNGRVFFDTAARVDLPARERATGYLFQDYALFPHLTVRENVAFGLRPPWGRLSAAVKRGVDEILERFELSRVAACRPGDISGGQRQRAALARAVIREPDALLLDEPFSALDIPLRGRMRAELDRLVTRLGIPMILVTHDPEDVRVLAREAAAYDGGEVVKVLREGELAGLDGFIRRGETGIEGGAEPDLDPNPAPGCVRPALWG